MSDRQLQREHARRISAVLALDTPSDLPFTRVILSSWRRCSADAGLDPFAARPPEVMDAGRLRALRERLEGLLVVAEPELRNLHGALAGSGFALVLTDGQGRILHQLTDDNVQQDFRQVGLWPGADWGEAKAGTNGIGTCIAEGRALTVHRDEHFLSRNIHLTCSAAPIRDPQGRLLAVLDSSCCTGDDSRQSQTFVRVLVEGAARTIENRHFLRELRDQRVLRFHQHPEHLGHPSEALLALGEDDRVLAVNQATLDLLGFEDRGQLVGQEPGFLFDKGLDDLLVQASGSGASVRAFRDQRTGASYYGFVYRHRQRPHQGAGLRIPPAGQDPNACRGDLCTLATLAGTDPAMREAARRAERVMDKHIPILLNGETGTGKELFAHAIHLASRRRDKPFVALNCAAIPETLIESELFGYRGGAFTGARREGRRGKILESSGGTLFLDEIGDMPPALQSRLLRVLETREVLPLGGDQAIQVDLHVITATHRDLAQQVASGEFREDLYYRINGITLALVPLRQRRDLEEIVLKVLAAENDTGQALTIAADAMAALLAYGWPGNLRQLRYVVRTAVALCENGVLRRCDLNLDPVAPGPGPGAAAASEVRAAQGEASEGQRPANPLKSAEQGVIAATLAAHHGNVSRTAEALAMSRNTLYRKMRKYGIGQSPD